MRDQYAGDVSDMLKFAFLRALADKDRTLGVAWYYAPENDRRLDGKHLEWREELAWKKLDPTLFDGLSSLSDRSVDALEKAPIWPLRTIFHQEPMPNPLVRHEWSARTRSCLDEASLVFLDPDNGLGTDPEKHATFVEVGHFRRSGRTVVFITFPKRVPHALQIEQLHERLKIEANAQSVVTLCTNVSVPTAPGSRRYVQRPRWFTMIDADAILVSRARIFADAVSIVPHVKAKLIADDLH